jgi:8-oxo-dGTP pyrophosphatase MutT (NUDIX family)
MSTEPPDEVRRLSRREVYRSRWMTVHEDEVEFTGGVQGTYSVVEKSDFAVVVPYADGGFWLVQQFRYPVGSRQWEFPQGSWPAGKDGDARQLAAAELREETGLRAGDLIHLGRLFAAYGYSTQRFDVFLATDLVPGATHREASEADMVHRWFAESQVRDMLGAGTFADAHSVAALALLDRFRAVSAPPRDRT